RDVLLPLPLPPHVHAHDVRVPRARQDAGGPAVRHGRLGEPAPARTPLTPCPPAPHRRIRGGRYSRPPRPTSRPYAGRSTAATCANGGAVRSRSDSMRSSGGIGHLIPTSGRR